MAVKICKNGHVGKYDRHRKCAECHRIYSNARYRANSDAVAARVKAARIAEPEKHRAKDRAAYVANKEVILSNAKRRRLANPLRDMLNGARHRARAKGCAFDVTEADLVMPTHCPLLGIKLIVNSGKHGPASPTIDKINSELGYVRGNVWVVSHRANALKGNATLEELRALVRNLERKIWELTQTENGTGYVPAVKASKTV